MKLEEITDFLCPKCRRFVEGTYCEKCNYHVQLGDTTINKTKTAESVIYDKYKET